MKVHFIMYCKHKTQGLFHLKQTVFIYCTEKIVQKKGQKALILEDHCLLTCDPPHVVWQGSFSLHLQGRGGSDSGQNR
jgi:hypothetical protein